MKAWIAREDEHEKTGSGRPDNKLLVDALRGWKIGFTAVDLISETDGVVCRCWLNKPRDEKLSYRDLDPAGLASIMVLCLAGGKVSPEPQGDGSYYYPRLTFPGERPSGTARRTQVLAIIADTPLGMRSVEPANYRSLLRGDLGPPRQSKTGEAASLAGATTAQDDALGWFREIAEDAPERLAPGLAECFPYLLATALRLLRKVPLGSSTTE